MFQKVSAATKGNMKTCFVLALCIFLTLRSAECYPSSSTSSGPSANYYPTQRRAISANEVENNELDISAGGISPQTPLPFTNIPLKSSFNPMNPFIGFKPFIPAKSSFIPPFVDPQIFIDKKSAILNNLFSPASAKLEPGFWVPASAAITPNYFTEKRNAFLNALFNQLASQNAATSANVAKRSIAGAGGPPVSPWAAAVNPKVFTDKKADFLNKLFESLNDSTEEEDTEIDVDSISVKPTIVPPNFWLPYGLSQTSPATKQNISPQVTVSKPTFPFGPSVVDPQIFIDKKTKFLNSLFKSLGLPPKPVEVPPTNTPIVSPGKLTSTTVYNQKVSEFLEKLFKSLNNTVTSVPESSKEVSSSDSNEQTSVKRRSIVSPYLSKPAIDPTVFADKKTNFLSQLFANLNAPEEYDSTAYNIDTKLVKPTIVPPNFWSPFASSQSSTEIDDDTNSQTAGYTSAFPFKPLFVKPTIVPPNFWSPFAATKSTVGTQDSGNPFNPLGNGISVVDPQVFVDKKTKFLSTLFNNIGLPPKPTKAPIVPPNFWIPSGKVTPTSIYDQKVSDFLDKLFNSLGNTSNFQKRHIDDDDDDDDNNNKKITEELSDITDDATDLFNSLSRRNVAIPDINSLQQDPLTAAKDKVVDTIIAELGGIKDNMLDTLAEIVQKQKEAAAAAAAARPAFPFGGPPPGVIKKGGPPPGIGKKGGPPPGVGKKFGGPYGGSFPFWGPTPKPTPDPTEPLQKRLEILNQVFEMLTKLQKDVSVAVNQAASDNTAVNTTPNPVSDEVNFISMIEKLIQQNNSSTNVKKGKKLSSTKPIREVQSELGSLLWPSKSSDPDKTLSKLQDEADVRTRSIQLSVHQGYQSLPPGAEELVQGGGGIGPGNREGGGIGLQNIDPRKGQKGRYEQRHHHHNN